MTLPLYDLIDSSKLAVMMEAGYVRKQTHPDQPLSILNYTEKCQYDRAWDEVTRQCRGLIYHTDRRGLDWVVARPWPKFHNYGEHLSVAYDTTPILGDGPETSTEVGIWDEALGLLSLDEPVEVTDKLDGSLGILYENIYGDLTAGLPIEDCWSIATRGSFTSEQAMVGTEILRTSGYLDVARLLDQNKEWTLLFEIVYPENRIVVDYQGRRELVLLGSVKTDTGEVRGPNEYAGWRGPVAEAFPESSLRAALEREPRPNREGIVVRYRDSGVMVKIKQDDYVALHRILTGTNARNVWEVAAVQACGHLIKEPKHWGSFLGIDPARAAEIQSLGDAWLADVPDEFYGWVNDTTRLVGEVFMDLYVYGCQLADEARLIADRKARYELVADSVLVKEVMRVASSQTSEDVADALGGLMLRCWRQACPAPTSPFARTEDVA